MGSDECSGPPLLNKDRPGKKSTCIDLEVPGKFRDAVDYRDWKINPKSQQRPPRFIIFLDNEKLLGLFEAIVHLLFEVLAPVLKSL